MSWSDDRVSLCTPSVRPSVPSSVTSLSGGSSRPQGDFEDSSGTSGFRHRVVGRKARSRPKLLPSLVCEYDCLVPGTLEDQGVTVLHGSGLVGRHGTPERNGESVPGQRRPNQSHGGSWYNLRGNKPDTDLPETDPPESKQGLEVRGFKIRVVVCSMFLLHIQTQGGDVLDFRSGS